MKDRQLEQLMQGLANKVRMDDTWSNNLKQTLMSQINEERAREKSASSLFWYRLAERMVTPTLAMKPVAVFSLILGLFAVSSFASVNASKNSLPGDTLYPIKLTAESLRYTLSFSNEGRTKVAMNRVEKRIDELKVLTAGQMSFNDSEKQEKIARATKEIKSNLNVVADKFQAMMEKVDESEMVAVKEIDAKLLTLKNSLEEVGQAVSGELNGEVDLAKEQIEKINAVAVASLSDNKNGEEVVANENGEGIQNNTTTPIETVVEKPVVSVSNVNNDNFDQSLIVDKSKENKEEFKVGIE